MNLLLFTDRDRIADNRIRISDRRLTHLRQVHGAQTGDRLRVGEIGGATGEGTIVHLDQVAAELALDLREVPPPKLPLGIVLALPRPKMLRRILRTVAECGVGELHLINSFRVEKSYWQTPVLQPGTLREYLLEGLEQARDTILPQVQLHRGFKPFVEDLLPQLVQGRRALLAHPGDYPACPADAGTPTLMVIGPEGGFIPYEVEKCLAAGCQPVSLGARTLRVETALTAIIGRQLQVDPARS
jgi:RsmE family RNA methyltransferase